MKPSINFLIITMLFYTLISCSRGDSLELVSNVDLFDIGLAKINYDEYYDIYTINHIFAESFLISDKDTFVESGLKLGLFQTNGTQDYEPTGRSPIVQKGLNIYSAQRKQLIIFCNKCSTVVHGSIKLPTPKNDINSVTLIHQEFAEYDKSISTINDNEHFINIDFTLEKSGLLVLDLTFMDLLIEFNIDYPSQSIFLGEKSQSPKSNNFSLNSRDNHSYAWAKVNNDMNTDVFMTTGGLRAKINKFSNGQILNELFYIYNSSDNQFIDNYTQSNIIKKHCRSYRSEWVDFDNDNDLDLYIGCKNGSNLLHQQVGIGTGKFKEVSNKYKVDFKHGDEFKWIDWNNDNQVDLLIIEKNRLVFYKNHRQKDGTLIFIKQKNSSILGKKLDSVNTSIKVADINNNGFPEIFVSTKKTIYYFEHDNNRGYVKKSLSKIGLPTNISGNLNLIDVDLDGKLDLCLFKHGIFIQNKNKEFVKTELLPELFTQRKYHFKNIIWFDLDLNGAWDVLVAESYFQKSQNKKHKLLSYEYTDLKQQDKLKLFRNSIIKNHNWLQIDLIGRSFNLDAIGAKIVVKYKNNFSQTRFNHGTNDSYHSQGHYRQYFGIKKNKVVDVSVIWPDDKVTNLYNIKANQLITIKY